MKVVSNGYFLGIMVDTTVVMMVVMKTGTTVCIMVCIMVYLMGEVLKLIGI